MRVSPIFVTPERIGNKTANLVELYFVCPRTGEGYYSEGWETLGELRVEEDPKGAKRLRGMVAVACPHCGAKHAYPTEELVCPLSWTGK
jgi:hypothetical protein